MTISTDTPTPANPKRGGLLPQPALSVVLFASWNLAQNYISPGTLIMGALLGWVIPLMTHRFWPDYPQVKSYLRLMRLLGVVLWDIVVANITVARQVLGPIRKLEPRFIGYPLAVNTDYAITLLASIVTLTPGTVSAFVSNDHTILWIHSLHAPDEQAVIDDIRRRYENPIKEIFE